MEARLLLPHRYPFVLLDTVEVTEEGRSGRGLKLITAGETCVGEDGVMGQAFIIEAMAQVSGVASGRKEGGFLAGMGDIEFLAPGSAEQGLVINSTIEGAFGGLYIFYCEAFSDGELAAKGKVILQLG